MKKQLLALALMSAAFLGCTDDSYDLDNMSTDYRIGLNEYLPIASSQVMLKDILSEFKTDYITENPYGLLTFKFDTVNRVLVKPIDIVFNETSFEFKSAEIDGLSDTIAKYGAITKNSSFFVDVPIKLGVDDKNGQGKISMIDIKEGFLKFRIASKSFDASSIFIKNINIADIDLDREGDPRFSYLEDTCMVNLEDLVLQFPNDELNVKCEFGVRGDKGDIKVTGNNIDINVVMEKSVLKYRKIMGSFKSYKTQVERTDFYLNLYDDNIKFKLYNLDPTLKITGRTNSGVPLTCSVMSLVGKHKTNKGVVKDSIRALFNKGLSNESDTFRLNFDYVKHGEGEVVAIEEEFSKDKNRTNLNELFSFLPDSVSVACGITIGSEESDTTSGVTEYFLLDSTYLDLGIEATVPFQIGDSSYLIIRDTVDKINIVNEITDYQNGNFELNQAEIFVEFENQLPLEAEVTAKFCTADTINGEVKLTYINNKKLDQVVRIPSAHLYNGFVTNAKPSLTKISVTDDMLDDIKRINAVDFTYNIKVPRGTVGGVFLTNDCGMSAKIYGHVKANISNTEK